MKFLCIGQTICDMYLHPAGPEIFEDDNAMLHKLEAINIYCGGDAANASCDLAKLGEEVALASAVGDDAFGNQLIRNLEGEGVHTEFMHRRTDVPTSVHTIILRDGARGNTYLDGCAEKLEMKDISTDGMDWADHVHMVSVLSMPGLDGDGKGVAELMRLAKSKGKTTSMDLDLWGDEPYSLDRISGALKNCDIFLPSILEAEAVAGTSDVMELKRFFGGYGISIFGVKLGAEGVFLTDFKQDIFLPSLVKGKPVDTLGAGDAFCSGFITAFKHGYDLKSCGLIASAASCFVCNTIGCSAGMVPLGRLIEFLAQEGYTVNKTSET